MKLLVGTVSRSWNYAQSIIEQQACDPRQCQPEFKFCRMMNLPGPEKTPIYVRIRASVSVCRYAGHSLNPDSHDPILVIDIR